MMFLSATLLVAGLGCALISVGGAIKFGRYRCAQAARDGIWFAIVAALCVFGAGLLL